MSWPHDPAVEEDPGAVSGRYYRIPEGVWDRILHELSLWQEELESIAREVLTAEEQETYRQAAQLVKGFLVRLEAWEPET